MNKKLITIGILIMCLIGIVVTEDSGFFIMSQYRDSEVFVQYSLIWATVGMTAIVSQIIAVFKEDK